MGKVMSFSLRLFLTFQCDHSDIQQPASSSRNILDQSPLIKPFHNHMTILNNVDCQLTLGHSHVSDKMPTWVKIASVVLCDKIFHFQLI